MNIMIHACPKREWYVDEYLWPSLIEQGIPPDNIIVWVDRYGRGNLSSCIETFTQVSEMPGDTWHLQDDVIVCRDFRDRIMSIPPGLVCGFCVEKYEYYKPPVTGPTTVWNMWQSSFPCIKIPNWIAKEFVEWFINEGQFREDLRKYTSTGKKDDTLFYTFMLEKHAKEPVLNMKPNLVDHIDYLIGGSVINTTRDFIARACYWDDNELIEELKSKLASRKDLLF